MGSSFASVPAQVAQRNGRPPRSGLAPIRARGARLARGARRHDCQTTRAGTRSRRRRICQRRASVLGKGLILRTALDGGQRTAAGTEDGYPSPANDVALLTAPAVVKPGARRKTQSRLGWPDYELMRKFDPIQRCASPDLHEEALPQARCHSGRSRPVRETAKKMV
jgi:hypothetical protein